MRHEYVKRGHLYQASSVFKREGSNETLSYAELVEQGHVYERGFPWLREIYAHINEDAESSPFVVLRPFLGGGPRVRGARLGTPLDVLVCGAADLRQVWVAVREGKYTVPGGTVLKQCNWQMQAVFDCRGAPDSGRVTWRMVPPAGPERNGPGHLDAPVGLWRHIMNPLFRAEHIYSTGDEQRWCVRFCFGNLGADISPGARFRLRPGVILAKPR